MKRAVLCFWIALAAMVSVVCTGGGGGGAAPAATITIGAAGTCPGGSITSTPPTWTQLAGGSWQLKMTVCVKCPNAAGTLVGVTGATVRGVVTDESVPAAIQDRTKVTGTTGAPNGCVTLSKRVAGNVKTRISGKTFRILFEDPAGVTLGRTTVTLP